MSDRGRDFLINWFSSHVESLPAVQRLAAAVRLASACRKDAIAMAIPLQEIRDAAGGDLIRKILEALDTAARHGNDAPLVPKAGGELEPAPIEMH